MNSLALKKGPNPRAGPVLVKSKSSRLATTNKDKWLKVKRPKKRQIGKRFGVPSSRLGGGLVIKDLF